MALLLAEAEKLSLPMLQQGVIETIVTTDQLFQVLPFKPVDGKSYDYNRESTLSAGDFLDVNDAVNEGAATFEAISDKLKRIIGDVDIDSFLAETMSDENDQVGIQISKKVKGISRTYADKLINGNATDHPKEFDGLLELLPSGQTLDVDGDSLSFDQLDWLIDQVKIGTAGKLFFVMNSRTARSYAALCRALGGTAAPHMTLPGVVGNMLEYRGVPILKNDYVPITQQNTSYGTSGGTSYATCTTVFLVYMDENEGVTGIASSKNLGIQVKLIGDVQAKDAQRYRVKWYCGLSLHSTLALAAVKGILD